MRMYDDCDDLGLDGESFRENLNAYVYANHYDEHTDDVYTSWQLNHYEIAKKILKELKTEKQNGPYNKIQRKKAYTMKSGCMALSLRSKRIDMPSFHP